ncbi:ABC transporter substrate-binding protein [Streptomyces fuscigenes]|nr:ABC transporter substrate-binding protein [Streptomyces fuscigenes]MCF3963570.1 ABC transporter substrate-binding protein [Streptomyces fuscigenes]
MRVRAATLRALGATAVSVSVLAGCGVLPGDAQGSSDITVMTWAPVGTNATNMPGMPAMAKAYARWADSNGGLAGHRLDVLTCNERNTPAGAAACAREAVAKKVDAVVGSYSQWGQQFMAPLEAASIPYIGGFGLSTQEFTSYRSYPVNGGQATLLAGNGQQLADSDCAHTALVRPDTSAGDTLAQLLDTGLATRHEHRATDVRAPEDATGYAQEAGQARDDAGDGGCVTAQLGDHTSTFFDSFRRLSDDGRDVRVSSVVGSVDQPLIDASGGADGLFENAIVTGWYPDSADPAWNAMKKVINKEAFEDDSIDADNAGVQTTWIAYTALAQIVSSVKGGKVDSGSIIDALDHGATVTTGGLTPPLRWRYQDMLGAPGFPRIVNPDVTYQVVRDGRLVAQKKGFVNVGRTLVGSNLPPQ